jgi:hypothetical protein
MGKNERYRYMGFPVPGKGGSSKLVTTRMGRGYLCGTRTAPDITRDYVELPTGIVTVLQILAD